MDRLRQAFLRILALFQARSMDRELQEELDAHLTLAADEHVRRGLSPSEARRRARLELGGVLAAREEHRAARGIPAAESTFQDLAYALRTFRRNRGFTFAAVLILALGIGTNTAVFSIVSPLMLRLLPFRDAHQLVWISPAFRDGRSVGTYPADVFQEMKRRSESFSDLSAYWAFFGYVSYTLTGRGGAEGVVGTMVAPRFFELLGVQPAAGRFFSAEESAPRDAASAALPRFAVISYGLWQRRFAGDPGLVGETITINNSPVTVIGILPADFDFGSVFTPATRMDLFLPAPLDAMGNWGSALAVIGRLKPGKTLQVARTEVEGLLPQILRDHPEWERVNATLTDLQTHVSGRFQRSLIFLWGAVGLVLLITCANLSSLTLARTTARRKELAIRMALGAGRARVVRQLLTEGVLLAMCGAAAGIPLAYGITAYLKASRTLTIPLLDRIEINGAALLFTTTTAIAAGLSFMALPAFRVSGDYLRIALSEQSKQRTQGMAGESVRVAMLVSEVALACVLLVGAGLLTRSLLQVLSIELGFQPSQAVAVRLNLPPDWSPEARARTHALLADLTDRMRAVPGIDAAGITDALPLERNRGWGVRVPGTVYPRGQRPGAFVYVTGPGYLSAMGIPMKAGRDFSSGDMAADLGTIIINESLARRLWPGQNPLQHPLLLDVPGSGTFTVVGVVADVRQASLEENPVLQMYLPYTQVPPGSLDLIVRSSLPLTSVESSIRATLTAIDPNLMSSGLRPVEDLVDRSVSPRRFLVQLIGGFSLLALTLACLGLYGVVSYTVSQRRREIGIRLALGAQPRDIRGLFVWRGLVVASIGVVIGLGVAAGLTRLMRSLLFGIIPLDPITFTAIPVVLAAAAVLASYLPARRAVAVDPVEALRAE